MNEERYTKKGVQKVPFILRGHEVELLLKVECTEGIDGFRRELIVVPESLYGRKRATVFEYSTRNGEHLTCLNKGGINRRGINYLGKELYYLKPDRAIPPENH